MKFSGEIRELRFVPQVIENVPHYLRVTIIQKRPEGSRVIYSETIWWNPGQMVDLTDKFEYDPKGTYVMSLSVEARVYG